MHQKNPRSSPQCRIELEKIHWTASIYNSLSWTVITKHCLWKNRHWWVLSIINSDIRLWKMFFLQWSGCLFWTTLARAGHHFWELLHLQHKGSHSDIKSLQPGSHSSKPSSVGQSEERLYWRIINAENCSANDFFHQILPNLWTELVIKLVLWTSIFFIYFQCYSGY